MIYRRNQFEKIPAKLLYKAEYIFLCDCCPAITDWVYEAELSGGEYYCPECNEEMEMLLIKV